MSRYSQSVGTVKGRKDSPHAAKSFPLHPTTTLFLRKTCKGMGTTLVVYYNRVKLAHFYIFLTRKLL